MLKNLIRRLSSFTYLNLTQFTGALNDNIFKLLIVYQFIDIEGIEQKYNILASTGAIFVLPFLLFSTSSGMLADRFSKRNIIIYTKILEVGIMLLGVFAFYFKSKYGSYAILFLLATQSAIFGPSKYGILPEIVSSDKITKANGLMTSFTFLAIILGTFIASVLPDIIGRNFTYGAVFCLIISLLGTLASFCIQYTPPAESDKKFNVGILREISDTLKVAKQHPSLLVTIFGSSFFLFLGAFVQLNLIPFAVEFMHLNDNQGGYLFLLMALGIGSGSIFAGKVSGATVELGLVPIAGMSVAICCFLLDFLSHHFYAIPPLVILAGFFGGIYQIPLDSYIQVTSPTKYRGQIVATTNFMSFLGVLAASGMLFLINEVLGFKADTGFAVVACITLLVTLVIGFQFFDYLSRFVAMILSKLHFKTTSVGVQNIPSTPAVYVCSHTAWNDTLLILGSQRRRVRFFIDQEQYHSKWMIRLYRLLRVVMVPSIEPLEDSPVCLSVIRNALKKGISVCIFVSHEDICSEIEKLKRSYAFQQILQENQYPLIPVAIEKGEKHHELKSKFLTRLLEKFRVPALISFGSKINDPDIKPENHHEDFCHSL